MDMQHCTFDKSLTAIDNAKNDDILGRKIGSLKLFSSQGLSPPFSKVVIKHYIK